MLQDGRRIRHFPGEQQTVKSLCFQSLAASAFFNFGYCHCCRVQRRETCNHHTMSAGDRRRVLFSLVII